MCLLCETWFEAWWAVEIGSYQFKRATQSNAGHTPHEPSRDPLIFSCQCTVFHDCHMEMMNL